MNPFFISKVFIAPSSGAPEDVGGSEVKCYLVECCKRSEDRQMKVLYTGLEKECRKSDAEPGTRGNA